MTMRLEETTAALEEVVDVCNKSSTNAYQADLDVASAAITRRGCRIFYNHKKMVLTQSRGNIQHMIFLLVRLR